MDETTSVSNSLREPPEGARRKRKVLSCHACRRRKLRCDRRYPSCGRCSKAGKANSCSYDEGSLQPDYAASNASTPPAQSKAASHAPPEPSSSNLVALARQINQERNRPSTLQASQTSGTWQLLGKISSASKTSQQRPNIYAGSEPPSREPRTESVIFRGENFKTQYYGGSNPTSIIAHFPELRSFMREAIMHHSSLPRAQRDLKSIQVRWKGDKRNIFPLTDLDLLRLLPARETVDHLVLLYFDTFETMYRILHRPSFWEEYQMFWENHDVLNPAFIILVLLIMAAASCLSLKEQPTYIGDSSLARERAELWIEVSEWWLARHSQKHIYLAIWQIRCLLVLVKQVNVSKKKRIWTAAGTLVREAMSAGFHRDPSCLGEKISVFDQEMRRRLWATMIELELQASVDRGMPSASAGIPSDISPVLNVNDEDLTLECERPPLPRPWEEYTTSSFLHISNASFSLRVSLNSVGNDLGSPLEYDEVLNYEEMITKELERLPTRMESGEGQVIQGMPAAARTLLEVQLQQFLILLHAPFAREASTNSRYLVSRMICFNAAASIVELYSKLTRSDRLLLLLLRHDYFRGALIICHNLYISMNIKNNIFLNSISNTLIHYIEDAVTMLEDRIRQLGTGYTHYWYISAALALLQSATLPKESVSQKQQAVDRLARQYHNVLASQEDFLTAKQQLFPFCHDKTNPTANQLHISSNITNTPELNFLDTSLPQRAFEEIDLPSDEFYFGDPAAWTFDNLWAIE